MPTEVDEVRQVMQLRSSAGSERPTSTRAAPLRHRKELGDLTEQFATMKAQWEAEGSHREDPQGQGEGEPPGTSGQRRAAGIQQGRGLARRPALTGEGAAAQASLGELQSRQKFLKRRSIRRHRRGGGQVDRHPGVKLLEGELQNW